MSIHLREGTPDDAQLVADLVRELAAYEKMSDEVTAYTDDFRLALAEGHAHVLIAERDGAACGMALYFFNFSTFLGRRGVYLEDLYVRESDRGHGVGKALLSALARVALDNKCARLDWAVLDWNAPSIAFYDGLGAEPLSDWITYRLKGEALNAVAAAGR